jgi:peptidoglycan/xylan/chitin deacetylase (PgdA/CDA1 family)
MLPTFMGKINRIMGIPILLYHRVGPLDGSSMDRYTVGPERFDEQMHSLVEAGYSTVNFETIIQGDPAQDSGRVVAITFDDGFRSNIDYAWPVLEKLGLSCTTFVVSNQLGGTNAWDDDDMPRYPLLTPEDILSANNQLVAFHCHTCNHIALPGLDATTALQELTESRGVLESLTGKPADVLAYPFGAWNRSTRQLAIKAGYKAACTCRTGLNRANTDRHSLRRVEILDSDRGLQFRIKLSTGRRMFYSSRF